jgi:hypothetical protein
MEYFYILERILHAIRLVGISLLILTVVEFLRLAWEYLNS